MKKYFEYMDERKVSDTLHQRLLKLKPEKRPAAWKKYGAAAAALVLVCGVGGFGAWAAHINSRTPPIPFYPEGADVAQPELGEADAENGIPDTDIGQPDIALEGPGDVTEPGMKTDGGYEITDGEMVSYYMLPYIEYGMSKNVSEMALDWDVPPGSVKRDLTAADIAALFGREENLSAHLGWGGYELTGWAVWLEDGSLWGMFLNGYKGPMDHFEFAFTTGNVYPPTCIGYGEGTANWIWDTEVTAWGYDGENGCARRVEFLKDGCGFRFDLTSSDVEQADNIVSRVTRWVLTEGVAADAVTSDGAVLAHPYEADPGYSVGEPRWEDSGAETRGYDPNEAADPAYNAPSGTGDMVVTAGPEGVQAPEGGVAPHSVGEPRYED